jgi:hypothetical protein
MLNLQRVETSEPPESREKELILHRKVAKIAKKLLFLSVKKKEQGR